MDSNFYSAEFDMEVNSQRDPTQLLHTTSPSSAHFYHGLGSLRRITSPDTENIKEVNESASVDDYPSENSRQSTPASASTFSKSDPGQGIKSPVQETFNKYLEEIEGPSRAQYAAYILPPPPSCHTAPLPFDRIAFKMDLEELKARMNEVKPKVNHHTSAESATRPVTGGKVEHEFSPPCASSSNDVDPVTHPRANTSVLDETPSRRLEGLYLSSSSTRKIRRGHTPKQQEKLASHSSEDVHDSVSASSGSSRNFRDVRGRLSFTRSIAVASRRTTERGTRKGLPSRRGCLL